MKRKNGTRGMAVLLACGMILSGCGKKDVDYNVDGNAKTDSGDLKSEYAIPAEIDREIDTGASGLTKLRIQDDDITVPNVGKMYTQKVKKLDLTEKEKQELIESIFDQNEEVYDYGITTKSEIQEELDGYLKLQEDATGDDKQAYTEKIESLREELASAPEEYPVAEDYTSSYYIGKMDGREYRLAFPETDASWEYTAFQIKDMKSYRPVEEEEATSVYCESLETYNQYSDTQVDETNACTLTEGSASDQAETFLRKLGASGLTQQSVSPLYWEYSNESGEVVAADVDGYVFTYRRTVDNLTISDVEIQNANNLNTSYEDSLEEGVPDICKEFCTIAIDANGIVKAQWRLYLDTDGDPEQTSLLSFDDLLEKADETIPAYYQAYPTVGYDEITFNTMKLTYYLKQGDTEGTFFITPAWVLTETVTYEDEAYTEINQIVILDAVTGEAIDLKELAKALGMMDQFDAPASE